MVRSWGLTLRIRTRQRRFARASTSPGLQEVSFDIGRHRDHHPLNRCVVAVAAAPRRQYEHTVFVSMAQRRNAYDLTLGTEVNVEGYPRGRIRKRRPSATVIDRRPSQVFARQ